MLHDSTWEHGPAMSRSAELLEAARSQGSHRSSGACQPQAAPAGCGASAPARGNLFEVWPLFPALSPPFC